MEALPKTVLVVEDDGPTGAFLADNLRADGYRVFCASEAGEAGRALEVRQPDLMLLDLGLAAGNGLEVLERFGGRGHGLAAGGARPAGDHPHGPRRRGRSRARLCSRRRRLSLQAVLLS